MFVDFFIKRPIFATVCALIIVLAGLVSLPTLPLAQYPDISQIVRFSWSGGNSHEERFHAAQTLGAAVKDLRNGDGAARIILIGHSHGGTVALLSQRS